MFADRKRLDYEEKHLSSKQVKDLMNSISARASQELSFTKINILRVKSEYIERKRREEEQRRREEEHQKRERELKLEEECTLCYRPFSEINFPFRLACKHTLCVQCLYQIASNNVDVKNQLFIIECPYRDSPRRQINITTNVLSDLMLKTFGYPPEQGYKNPKMKDLLKRLKSSNKQPVEKIAPGISLIYQCQDCYPPQVKLIYCGLKSYSLINMKEQECNKCKQLMPIFEIYMEDCNYKIRGDGDEKVNLKDTCVGSHFCYRLPTVSWDYLDFSAAKPNT